MKFLWKNKTARIVIFLVILVALYPSYRGARLFLGMYRWKTLNWAPHYLLNGPPKETVPDHEKHLIFIMVDHYEHGSKSEAVVSNRVWCQKFREISDRYLDDYGNKFRYTWFYPYDHHVEGVVAELSEMALSGYGEVEFHWHMGQPPRNGITPENYQEKLEEAIRWFQQFGAMITEEENPRTAFAYIAGVWDLDASRKPVSNGLTNQIEVLQKCGCYADFTFSTIATAAQPQKINSIYYVKDDPKEPKSHNSGTDVEVGKSIDNQLMIFQGPINIHWDGSLEYGAVESAPRFAPHRVPRWLESNIHGPEWVFVKVYSHGAQSSAVVLDHDMEIMLKSLKQYCEEKGMKLHFMSTREAFNVVKAAEAGKSGNPEDYRDFHIPKYQNMVRPFTNQD